MVTRELSEGEKAVRSIEKALQYYRGGRYRTFGFTASQLLPFLNEVGVKMYYVTRDGWDDGDWVGPWFHPLAAEDWIASKVSEDGIPDDDQPDAMAEYFIIDQYGREA